MSLLKIYTFLRFEKFWKYRYWIKLYFYIVLIIFQETTYPVSSAVRENMLSNILKGKDSNVYVKQYLLINGLDLTVDDKSILTRTINECFPIENK